MNANTTKVFFRVSQIIAGLAISFIVALGGLAAVEQISGAVSPAAAGTGWDSASGPDDGPGTGWDSTDDNPGTGWDSTDGPGTGWD